MRHQFIFICICFGITLFAQNEVLNVDYPASASLQTVQQGGKLSQTVIADINDSVVVSSISELVQAAKGSARHIIMTAGVYQMEDYLTPDVIAATQTDVLGRKAMLEFSGNNNTFDLSNVGIEVNTELLNDFKAYIIEFYVTGSNNIIKGLTVTDIGKEATSSGGNSFTVEGYNNRIENVTLNVSGSYPYGYGDLLGKGGGSLTSMRKHSGMLISGMNDTIVGCTIISRSFGHCFFIQGGRNIYFENCYAEGELRSTNDMLAEKSGLAFDLDFACVYKNRDGVKIIPPGYTKSLCECGFRIYGQGGVEKKATGAVTVLNCKAKNARIGFAFTKIEEPMRLENCEAISCEAGFNITGVDVINSKGDAAIGPLLYINKGDACHVELTLTADTSSTIVHSVACIAGAGHQITLLKDGDDIRPKMHGILLGTSRPAGSNPFSPYGSVATSNVTLYNTSGMPVELAGNTSNCKITSNGEVTNSGSGNSVVQIE